MRDVSNFALTGVAGFVAPRHLRAIEETGHRVVAAMDPHDAVGVLDRHGFDVRFFTEFERFDRHLEKLRRGPDTGRVHYLSICSPNHLHDAHIRLALRVGAHAICEKPVVINPWNLDALQELERETAGRVSTVLQLRLHPRLVALHQRIDREGRTGHDVELTYVVSRGRWFDVSWKGSPERSGGIATNIGIHLFDLLLWLFGGVTSCDVHLREPRRMAGRLGLERAEVRWFLSSRPDDLRQVAIDSAMSTLRTIRIDGEEVEFSQGFGDLHTRLYEDVLAGRGYGLEAARPSIELAYRIRTTPVTDAGTQAHRLMSLARTGG